MNERFGLAYDPKIEMMGRPRIASSEGRTHLKCTASKTGSGSGKILTAVSYLLFALSYCVAAHADAPVSPSNTSSVAEATTPTIRKFTQVFDIGGQPTHAALQDREGFLWFGSFFNGLVRFDGSSVKSFNSRTTGLSNDFVTQVLEDSEGVFWIGTNNGLNRYDKKTNTWNSFFSDTNDPDNSLAGNTFLLAATTIIEDRDGLLWFGTATGLSAYDQREGTFRNYRHEADNPRSLPDNEIRSVLEDRDGIIWVATHEGLAFIDKQAGTLRRLLHDPDDPNSLPANDISSMVEDRTGVLWFASKRNGLIRYDKSTQTFKLFTHRKGDPESVPDINIQEIYYTLDGKIALLDDTEGVGLAIFDPATGKTRIQDRRMGAPNNLSSDAILSLLEDKDGTLWAVHNNGKVDKHDPRHFRFEVFTHDPNNPNSIAYDQALPIYEDQLENLWIGTFGKGLERFDQESKRFIHYGYDPGDPTALPQGYPCGFFEDRAGNFYVSTFSGLVEFDRDTGKVIRHLTDDTSFYAMIQDLEDEDVVWAVGWDMSFNRFNLSTSERKIYKHDPDNPESFAAVTSIRFIAERDNPNVMWIATWGGGLEKFDKRTDRFTHHQHDPNDPTTISSNTVYDVIQDREGRIWATTDKGFNRLDPKTGAFQRFGPAEGFPATIVNNVVQDLNGFLWMGTNLGIVKFDPNSEKIIKTYSVDDGLVSHNFWPTSRVATRDGRLFFGGFNGVNSFRPESLEDNKNPPPIFLTSLQQDGEQIKTGAAPENLETLHLDWRNNSFEFQYVALNFLRPRKNRYQYILEGFDRGWYDAGADRKGRYSGLPGGTYTLKVRGSNNDGVWSTSNQEVSLAVHVASPPWLTWWAYLAYAITALTLLGGIYRWRMQTNIVYQHRLETDIQERTSELTRAYDIISSSIDYASHIQRSVLPHKDSFSAVFRDHLVLWEPRDVVGGDVYWNRVWGDGVLVILADCTGHGVPGAFMTLIATGALDRALEETSPGDVGKLIQRMHQFLQMSLGQHVQTGSSDDGLELGAVYVDAEFTRLTFVGARFELFQIVDSELSQIKGTSKGLGYRRIPYEQIYEEVTFSVLEGSAFYMVTDGLIDQVGGERKKMFGKKRFKKLLLDIQGLPMDQQREKIMQALADYQGRESRRDDVSMIGIKF